MFYIYRLVFARGQTYACAAVNRNPFETKSRFFLKFVSPHVRESNTVLGTGHYLSPGGVGGFWAKHDEI